MTEHLKSLLVGLVWMAIPLSALSIFTLAFFAYPIVTGLGILLFFLLSLSYIIGDDIRKSNRSSRHD